MDWTHIPPAMPSSKPGLPGPPPTRQTLTEKKKKSVIERQAQSYKD